MGLMPYKKKGRKRPYTRRKTTRRRSPSRARGNRRKPIQRGVTGRLGAIVMGVLPPAIAGIEATSRTIAVKKSRKLSGMGAVHYGIMRFVSDLSNGFIGIEPFTEKMSFSQEDGMTTQFGVTSGLPKGSLLSVAGTGLVMMGFDFFASKLAGGRPIKIIGTNYNATGGS